MAVDMKEMIAEAAAGLLMKKGVKKLTVKDIVEECEITRQAFYYHFADIPELLKWILERRAEQLLQEYRTQENEEEGLKNFFLIAINAAPLVKKGMQSNYGEELDQLLMQHVYQLFEQIVEDNGLYRDRSPFERKLIMRYHSQAIMGILRYWTQEDTAHLDEIVHGVYLLLTGR